MDTGITTQKSYLSNSELAAIAKMTESNKPYVEAKNSDKVALMDRTLALVEIYKLIVTFINASGENKKFHLDEEQLKNVSKFVYNFILEKYKGITILEVRNAFNLGITHEFGEYVGYGVTTFTKFIKGYMSSSKRESSMREWMKAQDIVSTTDKPVTSFFEQNDKMLNDFFDLLTPELAKRIDTLYTNEDTIYHLPSLYDFLRKQYFFEFSTETRENIIKAAKLSYYNYIKKSGLPQHKKDQFDMVVQSVKDYSKDDLMKVIETYDVAGINITYDYHVKSEALKVVLLGLKAKNKRPNNLKTI